MGNTLQFARYYTRALRLSQQAPLVSGASIKEGERQPKPLIPDFPAYRPGDILTLWEAGIRMFG